MSKHWQVPANCERLYEIRVSEPLLDDGNDSLVESGGVPGRRFVVLDRGVPGHWQGRLQLYFETRGVEARFLVVPGGKRCKTTDTVTAVVGELRRFGLDRRNEPIVVVGGGAVLDTAGFAAGVYRRGVPYVRVPTTLLGCVGASVGRRVGVHLGGAEDLIGTVSAPKLVLLDREFFRSLPPAEIANGLGTVLRLGLGCDPDLFDLLDAGADDFATTRLGDSAGLAILRRSIDAMLDQLRPAVVERDPSSAAELGHTFSRAFETPGLRHGEAVALNLTLSAVISARRGLLGEDALRRLADLTGRLGLPTTLPDRAAQAVRASLLDTTRHRASRRRTPLPCRIGACTVVDDVTPDEVLAALEELQGGQLRARRRVHRTPDLRDLPSVPLLSPSRPAPGWHVPVEDAVTYSIQVAEPLCDPRNPALLDSGAGSDRRLIAWDSNVPGGWRDAFRSYFAHHGVSATFVTVDGGESCKSLATTLDLLTAFQRHELVRSGEPLIVVGGGAVLDVVGFAASIYRCGIPLVRVPTTLLAHVDASVGIKTGVNFDGGKNLLGTFTPPGRVLLDCGFFSSLTHADWTSGLGEILKLGLGCDKIIFEMLEQGAGSFRRTRMHDGDGRALLYRSINVMLQELSGNIYENELARTVDLGHTFSQAFEMGEPAMSHGHAVAVDLLMSAAIAVRRSMMPRGDLDRLTTLTRSLGLPLAPPKPDVRATWVSLVERKQHRSERQQTPIPTEIGHCEFVDDLTAAEIEVALNWVVGVDREPPAGDPR